MRPLPPPTALLILLFSGTNEPWLPESPVNAVLCASGAQLVTEMLEVDWDKAQAYRRFAAQRLSEADRRKLGTSSVPVLLPQLESLHRPFIVIGEDWYSASIPGRQHSVLITGTRRRVWVDGADVSELPLLDETLGVARTEGIVEFGFRAFGVAYSINIECSQPADVRCEEDEYALHLADSLAVAYGEQ